MKTVRVRIAEQIVARLMRNVDGEEGDEFWLYKRVARGGFIDWRHLGSASRATLIRVGNVE